MTKEKSSSKKSSLKKEISQWIIIIAVAGILYATGYHTEVIGKIQSVLLYTGILQPDTNASIQHGRTADYNMPLLTLDGQQTSLQEFEGKTIFMNLWATWCPPCIAEMPNIQKLYDDIDDENIVFVMASLDENPEVVNKFITRKEFTFPVYWISGHKPAVFSSSVVPTTYVISPEGHIVMKHEGMAKYNTDDFKSFLDKVSSGADSLSKPELSP